MLAVAGDVLEVTTNRPVEPGSFGWCLVVVLVTVKDRTAGLSIRS